MATNVLEYLSNTFATDSRDWSDNEKDARLYGIICGWDDASFKELIEKFEWDKEMVNRIKRLHVEFETLTPLNKGMTTLGAQLFAEFFMVEKVCKVKVKSMNKDGTGEKQLIEDCYLLTQAHLDRLRNISGEK
jgi:hypothetical protein